MKLGEEVLLEQTPTASFDKPQDAAQKRSSSFTSVLADSAQAPNSMEWTNISLTIKDKTILQDVSGSVNNKEMACVLGPSGAGKSTLLNVLAGRMNVSGRGKDFSGKVSIGGALVDPVAQRSNIAYVMQDDALPGTGTPREILTMSAILRGAEAGGAGVQRKVNELLTALRLDKCADSLVGNLLVKGLSGGEKKRTAVAVELITSPRMLFLDEPLSGLDSYAAWTLVQVLKDIAEHGCAVLCTIHQPSSEIFQSFEKLICLVDGKTVYCNSVKGLPEYMAKLNHPVPKNYNPADHLLFTVQSQSTELLGTLIHQAPQELLLTAWMLGTARDT